MIIDRTKLVGGDMNVSVPEEPALPESPSLGRICINGGNVKVKRNQAWSSLPSASLGVGPAELIAGDMAAGFFGEVAPTEFISGSSLAQSIGLTQGNSIYDSYPWLKCALDGKVVFLPQRALRNDVSWLDIYNVGAVHGDNTYGPYPPSSPVLQDATVEINGDLYRVRLLRGSSSDSFNASTGYDTDESLGSEWNQLLYRLCASVPASQSLGNLADYSQVDLGVADNAGLVGQWAYCMESYRMRDNAWLKRGGYGITSAWATGSGFTGSGRTTYNGWRPVLELMS